MPSSLVSAGPHQVRTIEEAQILIDEAHAQEIFCRRIKELSEIRAKEAIAEASLAYKKLLDAELHTGRVFYVVEASGFQAQNPNPAQPPVVVQISGGTNGSKYLRWVQDLITIRQYITLCLSQGMGLWKSSWTERFDCIIIFAKTQHSFQVISTTLILFLIVPFLYVFVRREYCLFVGI